MGDYSDSSNNLQFLFKKSLGVVSTLKNVKFYNEISRIFRTPVQAEDVNIETTPTLPVWNDSSDNSLFNLGSDDFASVDFTELHTFDTTYTKNGTKSPGVYLDSSGIVALFVRLKLDKMEGTESTNLDASAIVYKKISSPSVYWTESNNYSQMNGYLPLIDTTRPLTINRGSRWGSNEIFYSESLSTFVDLSTAVATVDLNTNTSNTVILDQTTEVFMLVRHSWSNTPSTDGWARVDDGTIDYLTTQDYTYIYRRIYKPGTYDFDNTTAAYIFQRLPESSLMDSAYQFNYNSQINVNSSIPVFKPYNYTLEYSSDDSTFYQVTNDMGNWSFDTNSGTIIFEDDPSLNNSIIDLSNGDLYFTFVKYVGLQGIENLIYHNQNGYSGIGTKAPETELDISGTVTISENLEITNNLYTGTTLCVDSSNERIGINTLDPSDELHVVGNVNISEQLSIGDGFGAGMCPIGTIIIWTSTTEPNGYGEWHLCDGTDLNSNNYPDLSNIIGSSSNLITLPDFRNKYTKGGPLNGETDISYGGTGNTSDISLNVIPSHTHTFNEHTHDKLFNSATHHHQTLPHTHNINVNVAHTHVTNNHSHSITETSTTHTHNLVHSHYLNTDNKHTHSANHTHNTITEVTSGHTHGSISYINEITGWDNKRKGNGSGGIRITETGTASGSTTQGTTENVVYNSNDTGNATSTLSTNSDLVNASVANTTAGTITANTKTTNITETNQSTATATSSSTFGINQTSESTLIDTSFGFMDIELGGFTDTHNFVRPNGGTTVDSFSFSARPQCIEIFYYIRVL